MSQIPEGLVLFFMKDGIIYPVAMTEYQKDMFDLYMKATARKAIRARKHAPR